MRFPASLARLRPALAAGAAFVVVCTLTRIAIALRPETAPLGSGDLARSFGWDSRSTGCAARPRRSCLARARAGPVAYTRALPPRTLGWFGIASPMLLLAVAEWLFWEEFGALQLHRRGLPPLHPRVLGNIWESCPVGWLLGARARRHG
jgi:hypothetical protein